MSTMIDRGRDMMASHFPGLLACVTVAVASVFLTEHHGGPTMLYALLLGIAFNFLSETDKTDQGDRSFPPSGFCGSGWPFLGLRISFDQIAGLGWAPALLMVAGNHRHHPFIRLWLRFVSSKGIRLSAF